MILPARRGRCGLRERDTAEEEVGAWHVEELAELVTVGGYLYSRGCLRHKAYMHPVSPQPLITVNDVEASSRWYQRLLGCRSDHGGPNYERLVMGERLVMQLHAWETDHDHGRIGDPELPRGNGVLLWFEIDDFDAAVARSGELGAEVVLAAHRNPPEGQPGGPAHREIWLRDPDGYTVVLASPDGEAALGSV